MTRATVLTCVLSSPQPVTDIIAITHTIPLLRSLHHPLSQLNEIIQPSQVSSTFSESSPRLEYHAESGVMVSTETMVSRVSFYTLSASHVLSSVSSQLLPTHFPIPHSNVSLISSKSDPTLPVLVRSLSGHGVETLALPDVIKLQQRLDNPNSPNNPHGHGHHGHDQFAASKTAAQLFFANLPGVFTNNDNNDQTNDEGKAGVVGVGSEKPNNHLSNHPKCLIGLESVIEEGESSRHVNDLSLSQLSDIEAAPESPHASPAPASALQENAGKSTSESTEITETTEVESSSLDVSSQRPSTPQNNKTINNLKRLSVPVGSENLLISARGDRENLNWSVRSTPASQNRSRRNSRRRPSNLLTGHNPCLFHCLPVCVSLSAPLM